MDEQLFENADFQAGTAPRDLILERAARLQRAYNDGEELPEHGGVQEVAHYVDLEDLVTNLDALWLAHVASCEKQMPGVNPAACDTRFRAYRDHKLCALSINEPLEGEGIGIDA